MPALEIRPEELLPPPAYHRPRPAVPVVPRERVLSFADRQAREMRRRCSLAEFREHTSGNVVVGVLWGAYRLEPSVEDFAAHEMAEAAKVARHHVIRKEHEIARHYNIRHADLRGPWRKTQVVRARHHLMWWIRHNTDWSLPKIGKHLKRDHTTIIHGIRKHQESIDAGIAEMDTATFGVWS